MNRNRRFIADHAGAGIPVEALADEFGTSVRQVRRYIAGQGNVPKLVAERMQELAAARRSAFSFGSEPAFRFIDLFVRDRRHADWLRGERWQVRVHQRMGSLLAADLSAELP